MPSDLGLKPGLLFLLWSSFIGNQKGETKASVLGRASVLIISSR